MNVLILGGSGFIGRHTASALLAADHRVSVLQRGDGAVLPAGVQRLQGDRDVAMPALATCRWDACLDICGYFPRSLLASCAALAGVRRYVYVSAVRVYGDPAAGPVTEDFPRVPPAAHDLYKIDDVDAIDDGGYGPLKVACEDVVQATLGERATLLRPQGGRRPGRRERASRPLAGPARRPRPRWRQRLAAIRGRARRRALRLHRDRTRARRRVQPGRVAAALARIRRSLGGGPAALGSGGHRPHLRSTPL